MAFSSTKTPALSTILTAISQVSFGARCTSQVLGLGEVSQLEAGEDWGLGKMARGLGGIRVFWEVERQVAMAPEE